MVKFDEVSIKYLKIFINKRDPNIKFDFIKAERNAVLSTFDNNIKYTIVNEIIPLDKIKRLFNTKWVALEAINNIANLDSNYKISWNKHHIYLKCTTKKFDAIKKRISILLNMLNYIYNKKPHNKPLKIYLILIPLKKFLEPSQPIKPKHINTGYTDFDTNEILCWREEEFEKVLFHEMIHYMYLDDIDKVDDYHKHSLNNKNYQEAITDFWGIIYNLIYISIITKKSVLSLFQIEYAFMENQALLINAHLGLGDWSQNKQITQYTSAYTYFIVKFLIFKKIVELNNIDMIYDTSRLFKEIFNKNFLYGIFINKFVATPPCMTLLQLY